MRSVCIISEGYPTKSHPYFTFVKMVADEFCKLGLDVYVIAPQSLIKCVLRGTERHPAYRKEQYGEHEIIVYQPFYLSFGNKTPRFNNFLFERSFRKIINTLPKRPDFIYGHFWHSAFQGFRYAKEYNIPLFVATGESGIYFRKDSEEKIAFCEYVKGVICVSTKNKDESVKYKLTDGTNCIVLPNAIDNTLFRQMDKLVLRAKYNFGQNDFIVCFVGWFIHRKGPDRVANAIRKLENRQIKSFFIGSPLDQELVDPVCDNILFKGRLSHELIPEYLNMADIFVLPTLHEGCCNAVIEAMACGLPVVSSNLPFNWDVLDNTNSIMVDPNCVDEIADAIKRLYDEKEERKKLSEGSLIKARDLTIRNRARKILNFIEERS